MTVLYIMLPVALLIAGAAVLAFVRAARAGQYDDLDTPAYRMLSDDDRPSACPSRFASDSQTPSASHERPASQSVDACTLEDS